MNQDDPPYPQLVEAENPAANEDDTPATRWDSVVPAPAEDVELKIRRQDDPFAKPYWQRFRLPGRPGDSVIALLRALRLNPVTSDGERVDPVAFEHNCMEEICGACAMLINGRPRQACSALVAELTQPIVLEPLPKFPLVRDLMVDRGHLFEQFKRVKAWISIDGSWEIHRPGLVIAPHQVAADEPYSRCMSCGCCLAACPQYDETLDFVGPAALAQVRLLNAHPNGRHERSARLHAIMSDGGVSDCGNAQNCVRVCPQNIPLTTAIGELGRATTVQLLRDLFG